ncbi:hypothetical protein ACLQ2P_30520 [Actinomadura citrea]|uniref:hypothetical protein n=1 Tax=Actinomadura citrea TaxID=46158 RepID=UPI003CE49E12
MRDILGDIARWAAGETFALAAVAVGLTCGGVLDVPIEPVGPSRFAEIGALAAAVKAREPAAVATVVAGPDAIGRHRLVRPVHSSGSLGTSSQGAPVDTEVARAMLAQEPDRPARPRLASAPLACPGHAWSRLVAAET